MAEKYLLVFFDLELHAVVRNYSNAVTQQKRILCRARFSEAGKAVSFFKVKWILSCLPFCSGLPGSIHSGITPPLMKLTDNLESLPGAHDANAGPLSLRIWTRKPYSRNDASSNPQTLSALLKSILRIELNIGNALPKWYMDYTFRPSYVKKYPLKSIHQTSFASRQCANGSVLGGTRRRKLRGKTRPFPFKMLVIVVFEGQSMAG